MPLWMLKGSPVGTTGILENMEDTRYACVEVRLVETDELLWDWVY